MTGDSWFLLPDDADVEWVDRKAAVESIADQIAVLTGIPRDTITVEKDGRITAKIVIDTSQWRSIYGESK